MVAIGRRLAVVSLPLPLYDFEDRSSERAFPPGACRRSSRLVTETVIVQVPLHSRLHIDLGWQTHLGIGLASDSSGLSTFLSLEVASFFLVDDSVLKMVLICSDQDAVICAYLVWRDLFLLSF